MQTTLIVCLILLGLASPFLAFLIAKFGTIGCLHGRQYFHRNFNEKGKEDDAKTRP